MVRLHKFMASCGIASRRKCEILIEQGEVRVNGKTVTELGTQIDDAADTIEYRGKRLAYPAKKYYIVNKPAGYLTTSSDPNGRRVVFDLVPSELRLFAVGRLDRDTEGLILLTNDGDTANRIAHPSNNVTKTYYVYTKGKPDQAQLARLRNGMVIDGHRTARADVSFKGMRKGMALTVITICEGRNRQVRKMFDKAGLPVVKLIRTAIGGFSDRSLKTGRYRELSQKDLKQFFQKRGKE